MVGSIADPDSSVSVDLHLEKGKIHDKKKKMKKFYVWIFSLESCRLLLELIIVLQAEIQSFYFIFSTLLLYFWSFKNPGLD